jgi:hypothetical protein
MIVLECVLVFVHFLLVRQLRCGVLQDSHACVALLL